MPLSWWHPTHFSVTSGAMSWCQVTSASPSLSVEEDEEPHAEVATAATERRTKASRDLMASFPVTQPPSPDGASVQLQSSSSAAQYPDRSDSEAVAASQLPSTQHLVPAPQATP